MRQMQPNLFLDKICTEFVPCETTVGETIKDAIIGAKQLALEWNSGIFFVYEKVPVVVTKYSNIEEVQKFYYECIRRYEEEKAAGEKEQHIMEQFKESFAKLKTFPYNPFTFAFWFYDFSEFAKEKFIELKFLREVADFMVDNVPGTGIKLKNAQKDFRETVNQIHREKFIRFSNLFSKCKNACEFCLKGND